LAHCLQWHTSVQCPPCAAVDRPKEAAQDAAVFATLVNYGHEAIKKVANNNVVSKGSNAAQHAQLVGGAKHSNMHGTMHAPAS
jgi:hypothetical protein